jgi:hypothetical protein
MATPANKKALANHFEHFLAERLSDCTTCHLPSENHSPHSLEDFPHNAFGDALRQLGQETPIVERIEKLAASDADADGVPNLTELLLGSLPGDKDDQPGAERLQSKATRHEAFAAFLQRYPWQPFQPVKQPDVPDVVDATLSIANPIDAFVAQQQSERGLKARPQADKLTLLRRVHLDLTGISPTPEEQAAFLADPSPQAYERVVDRLLNDSRHGERWARHWMDVWRYSDWDGYKDMVRISQPHIWRWRDWIIESLNADKPYSRMVQEMLAADELAPEDLDALRATGFLVRNYHRDRYQWMDMVVEHTSKAFMGLTMNCVKCHDHKYDPIPQEDYYRIRAVFEPYNVRTEPVPGELDTNKDGLVRSYDKSLKPVTYMFDRGDERSPIKDQPIAPGVPGLFGGKLDIQAVKLPLTAKQPEKRAYVREALLKDAEAKLVTARSECDAAKGKPDLLAEKELKLKAAEARRNALLTLLPLEQEEDRGMDKKSSKWQSMAARARRTQLQADLLEAEYAKTAADNAMEKAEARSKAAKSSSEKANAKKALDAAKAKLTAANKKLAAANKAQKNADAEDFKPREVKTYPDSSTGRRLAFARWLTSDQNTLFARVAMNHVWLRHFGTGLVATPDDFGANGKKPTHPALLDWLAAEFIERNYSLKEMHKLIVTSCIYRLASTTDEANARIDPDNVWMWRAPTRRMEGEIVRDNLLATASLLDREVGGPDIDNEDAEASRRRSIYLRHAQEKKVEFIRIFDGPSVNECYQRERSIKPHQALAMLNSQLTRDAAAALEADLHSMTRSDGPSFIEAAFARILGRTPKPDEVELCRTYLTGSEVSEDPTRARQQLLTILFNHNDFVTVR